MYDKKMTLFIIFSFQMFTDFISKDKGENTVNILSFRTDRSVQTVQTQIELEQSDQGLYCLPLCVHFLGLICTWQNHNDKILGYL